jgi:hypothetical protein
VPCGTPAAPALTAVTPGRRGQAPARKRRHVQGPHSERHQGTSLCVRQRCATGIPGIAVQPSTRAIPSRPSGLSSSG